MLHQRLLSTQEHPVLLDAQSYQDLQAVNAINQSLERYFGHLENTQRQRYFELARQVGQNNTSIAESLADCLKRFEQEGLEKLRQALAPLSSTIIDPQRWYFHTQMLLVPPRHGRAIGIREPIQKIQSYSLWDAARLDLNKVYPRSYQNNYLEHSYISRHENGIREFHEVLGASSFELHAHALDLGSMLEAKVNAAMDARFMGWLTHYHEALFGLALLDDLRQEKDANVARQAAASLSGIYSDSNRQWKQYQLKFTGATVPLPFFTCTVRELGSERVVSYFPNRAGGALRRHFSEHAAVEALLDQVKRHPSNAWFLAGLDKASQGALHEHLATPVTDRDNLNWISQKLYDLMQLDVPPIEKLQITAQGSTVPIRQGLHQLSSERFKADLLASAATLSSRRWKALKDHAGIVVSETLGLLTLALPGGVVGANRLMVSVSLGALGHQVITAALALSEGERAQAVQAVIDVTDLIVTGALQVSAGKLSQRRTRQLMHSLLNPRPTHLPGPAPAAWSTGPLQSESGAYGHLDIGPLTDARLLQLLTSSALPTLEATRAERLLALADVSRGSLEAIWYSQGEAPWQLLDLLQQENVIVDLVPTNDISALKTRFPLLSPAARAHLYRHHPELSRLTHDTLLNHEQLQAILMTQLQQRVINALSGLESSSRVPDPDSEALFCSMLLADPHWPESLGIQVYDAVKDRNGLMAPTRKRLATYELDSTTTFIRLYRSATHYAGSLETGDLIQVDPGQAALAQALLRTLDDVSRQSLGVNIYEPGKLISQVEQQALAQRTVLEDLLPERQHYPLSTTRLADFSHPPLEPSIQADHDGIYRTDNKLFITMDNFSYQVLHDRDASSPDQSIWRIVRSEDAVADTTDNLYVATRPGRSEPVTRDVDGNWQGVLVGGPGGSGRGRKSRLQSLREANQARQRQQQERDLVETDAALRELSLSCETLEAKQKDFFKRSVIIASLSRHPGAGRDTAITEYCKYIDVVDEQLKLLQDKPQQFAQLNPETSLAEFTARKQRSQLTCYERAIYLHDLVLQDRVKEKQLDATAMPAAEEILGDVQVASNFRQAQRLLLDCKIRKLPLTLRYERTLQALKQSQHFDASTHDIPKDLQPSQTLMASIQFIRGVLLGFGDPYEPSTPAIFNVPAKALHHELNVLTRTIRHLDSVPDQRRFAVLANLQEKLEALTNGFEQLATETPLNDIDRNNEHIVELLKIIHHHREHCDTRLAAIIDEQKDGPLPSTALDGIDFDFIPSQHVTDRPGPSPSPRRARIVAVRHHGRDRLVEVRSSPLDADLLTVVAEDDRATRRTLTRTQQGTWQMTAVPSSRTLTQLDSASTSRLEEFQSTSRQAQARALRDDAVAADISDSLLNLAEEMDILTNQYGQADLAPLPAASATLNTRLQASSAQLRSLAQRLEMAIYKNPRKPKAAHLAELIKRNQVTVRKLHETRATVGRGQDRSFMDAYSIMDTDGKRLWEAHFHYPALDTPRAQYAFQAGHLKTLEDARKGIMYQRGQERAGLKIHRILRVEIPLALGASIFELADRHEARPSSRR